MDDYLHTDPNAESDRPAPVMDIKPPSSAPLDAPKPPENKPVDSASVPAKLAEVPNTKAPKPKPVSSNQSSGNAGPIVATVIIILSLAVLATYAYLKSK